MLFSPHRRNLPLLTHLAVWGLVTALVMMPPFGGRFTMPDEYWLKQTLLLAMLVGAFYLNSLVLLPRLLFQNRTALYIIAIGGVAVSIYWTIQAVEAWLHLPELWQKAVRPDRPFNPERARRFDIFTFLYTLLSLGASTSVTMVQKWQKDAQIRERLEKEKIKSELSFLKAQINPHFFFNTLNNIYALTMIDVETAREALHRLSRMMRYVLYETKEGTVQLSQEMAFLQDYIQLMQLRLTDKVQIEFEKPNSAQEVAIAPMLLLPFLENSFKHGISATQPSKIRIAVTLQNTTLRAEIRNTLFAEKGLTLDESNGIGLINTRRRLDLLYPNSYTLQITPKTPENEYLVELTLQTTTPPLSPTNQPIYETELHSR
jgi:two-component system, LytTR family, sensor kinase